MSAEIDAVVNDIFKAMDEGRAAGEAWAKVRAVVERAIADEREVCAIIGENALSKLFSEGMARNVPHVIGDAIRAPRGAR